jgi:hypothetical protein
MGSVPGAGLPGVAAGLASGFTSWDTPGWFGGPAGGYGAVIDGPAGRADPTGTGGGVPINGAAMTGRGGGAAIVGDNIDSIPRGDDIGLAICGAAGAIP